MCLSSVSLLALFLISCVFLHSLRFDSWQELSSLKMLVTQGGNAHPPITSEAKMASLNTLLLDARQKAVLQRLGPDIVALLNNCTINNGNIVNVNVHIDSENGRNSDNNIVKALFASELGDSIRLRIKYAPQAKTANCNGLYYCDPSTNVWTQRSNAEMEEIILPMFEAIKDSLSPADQKHINSRRGTDDMRHIVGRKCGDRSFKDKLDGNRDLLAADNGVWDVPNKTFRPIEPDDFIMTTTGWSYDPLMAQQYRHELETFIAQVMPIEDEREATLAFYANLMSGYRGEKKLLILTDLRGGNNGKSTYSDMFVDFFGKRAVSQTEFVCLAGPKDMNSHNAGIEGHAATRLLVADELKAHMALDVGLLKRLTGGITATVGGRSCHGGGEAADRFKFKWQAGIVLVFNEGDCPKFDGGDSAFIDRLVVPLMRAKFLPPEKLDDADDYSLPKDTEIAKKFPLWRSAIADMLMEKYNKTVLDELPPSFSEWRLGLARGANQLSEWLMERLEVTGSKHDCMLLQDVRDMYDGPTASFDRLAKAFLQAFPNVTFRARTTVRDAQGSSTTAKDVFRGARLK